VVRRYIYSRNSVVCVLLDDLLFEGRYQLVAVDDACCRDQDFLVVGLAEVSQSGDFTVGEPSDDVDEDNLLGGGSLEGVYLFVIHDSGSSE